LFYSLQQACSPEIIQLLFETYPKAITERDFCGENPLFIVYHKSKDPRILKAMLDFQPSLATQKVHSFSSPDLVTLVCSPWEKLEASDVAVARILESFSNQWEKVVITCSAAHKCRRARNKEIHEIKELHLALELPCSPKVLSWFIKMYPEQVSMPLSDGMLPLHRFLSTRELIHQTGAANVMAEFIAAYPPATCTPFRGNMPLHLAIASGCHWEKGLRRLLYFGPEALQLPEHRSRLLPFMLAASSEVDLGTVYALLREGPTQLQ
jgi:hypothetical protein